MFSQKRCNRYNRDMDENRHTGGLSYTNSVLITPIPDPTVPQAGSHFPVEPYTPRPLLRYEKKLPLYIATALVSYVLVVMGMSGAWRFGIQGVVIAFERTSQSVLHSAFIAGERIQETAFRASTGATLQSVSIIDVLASALKALLEMITDFFSAHVGLIAHNWKIFFAGNAEKSIELSLFDREAVKAELKEELLREFLGSATSVSGAVPRVGVVVIKSTGDQISDAALELKVKEAFSDEIKIRADESRRSGIISPVFLNGKKQEYLYVLVPLTE